MWGLSASLSGLDPHEDIGGPELQVLVNVYEGLVGFDSLMAIEPRLARSWESIDDRNWIFRLRDGVFFHDGTTLDAEDVVFSFDRSEGMRIAALPTATALDSLTVQVTLERPDPLFLGKITELFIIPAGSPDGVGASGTGPYRLVAEETGTFRLQGFRDHWRGPPAIATAFLVTMPDDEGRVNGLFDGRLDFVTRYPMQLADRAEEAEDYSVRTIRSLRLDYVGLRVDRPPFDEPLVRRAMSLAIDRQAIVDEIHGGFGVALNQFSDSNVRGFVPDRPRLIRDVDRARKLLAEAGYPDGISITVEGTGIEKLEALARQLEPAGFRVALIQRTWGEFYPRVKNGEVDAWMMAWLYFPPDLSELLEQLLHTPSSGLGIYNNQGYSNPELDELVERLVETRDTGDRQKLMAMATDILLQDLPIIPLKSPHLSFGFHRDLEWNARPDGVVELFRLSWFERTRDQGPNS